jgi:hypothetical protein
LVSIAAQIEQSENELTTLMSAVVTQDIQMQTRQDLHTQTGSDFMEENTSLEGSHNISLLCLSKYAN